MKRGELYERIVERLPGIVVEEYEQTDVCIPASYHALEVLREHGIPASLAVMDCVAANRAWAEWIATSPGEDEPMPEGAHSVGVDSRFPSPLGLGGHLIVRSKGWTIDCSSGQMSRPGRGIVVPPGLRCRGLAWQQGDTLVLYRPSSVAVPPMWKGAPEATARVRERIRSEVLS
jgi:hypothetical protein